MQVDKSPPPLPAAEDGLDPIQEQPQSFIIKIWLERLNRDSGQATWRGTITHVPSGERSYVLDLDDILNFIIPYLQVIGAKLKGRWRVWQWLNRRWPRVKVRA